METKEYVEYLLKNYHVIKEDIEQLKLEMQYLEEVAPEEVIEALNYGCFLEEKVQTGQTSDKTSHIAMVYRQVAERLNRTSRKEILKMIAANEFEFMRLEHCIDRLE